MEILTMDFMEDFGFTNVEQASVYSLNIENSTEFVSNVESKGGGEDNLRVRGMGQARRSREFFATGWRTDNYNLEYRYNIQPVVENGRMRDPVFSGVNYTVDTSGRRGLGPLGSDYSAGSPARSICKRRRGSV